MIMIFFDAQNMRLCKKAGISAVIVSDISAINYANSIGLKVHISTQTNVSNLEAVKFYSKIRRRCCFSERINFTANKNICAEIKKQNIKGPSENLLK